jgi:hypothetical protein
MEGMKTHLRADSANGKHTRFTVFMNGGNCGQLCMTEEEAIYFHEIITRTDYLIEGDEIKTSGKWFKECVCGKWEPLFKGSNICLNCGILVLPSDDKYDCPIHGMSDGLDCPRC